MKNYFAPMEGLTGFVFRNAHHKYYGGVEKYFTPFVSPNKVSNFTPREKRDVLPENNKNTPVVPQILTNHASYFIETAKSLEQMGYQEINLNLGCPSKTVTTKKKGAGFLAVPNDLDHFLEEIYSNLSMKISVKTRLGLEDPEEFDLLLEIFNAYPIFELIIHPRVQTDFYKGLPRLEYFKKAVKESKNPLCYNGNIFNLAQYEAWQTTFKGVDCLMLGRGAIANPSLPLAILNRRNETFDEDKFLNFHQEILDGYLAWGMGDRNVLFKMKELWYYFGSLYPEAKKAKKKIKKTQKLEEYIAVVENLICHEKIQLEQGFLPF